MAKAFRLYRSAQFGGDRGRVLEGDHFNSSARGAQTSASQEAANSSPGHSSRNSRSMATNLIAQQALYKVTDIARLFLVFANRD